MHLLTSSSTPCRTVACRAWILLVAFVLLLLGPLSSAVAQGVPEAAHRVIGAAQGVTEVGLGDYAVVYRPRGVEYLVQPREHFDVIYQRGAETMAQRTGDVLETTWAGTDSLVGPTTRLRMPVVLNDYNDRSNGFVTPFPFKQEIEAPSIHDDALTSNARSWPSLVATHELVHAAHATVDGGFGVGSVLRVFAPDWSRATNLTAPQGLVEGVAVYRESTAEPGSGRLNNALFRMKMRAAMLSDDPWSFEQMMEPPTYTRPFNRFYIGGAHAFEHLATRGDTTSFAFFQDAVAMHDRLPVLGFGVWLWRTTGMHPGELEGDLRAAFLDTYRREVDALGTLSAPSVVGSARGLVHRRPFWIDATTLVAYVEGYDVRPGFYRIDAQTGARHAIRVQSQTEDHAYSVTPDTAALLVSRYVPDPFVPSQFVAEVERVDLQTGDAQRLTSGGRAFAPVEAAARHHPGAGPVRWAVRNDGPFTQWAVLRDDGSAYPLTNFSEARVRRIAPSPADSTLAVLVNVDGDQRIFRGHLDRNGAPRMRPWIGFADATIFDLAWGPDGRYLVFSADPDGVANVFSLDTETGTVRRHTNVAFGALEPALSPDGATLAYVRYRHERYDLVRQPFDVDAAWAVPASQVQRGKTGAPTLSRQAMRAPTASTLPEPQPYRARRYLAPRMIYPTFRYDDTESVAVGPDDGWAGVGVGVGLAGADPLQRWAYRAETFWQDDRLWGEARVQTGRWLLRPSLTLFDRPEYLGGGVGFEERGVSLGLRLPVTLASNVYQSVARVALETEVRQTRFYEDGGDWPGEGPAFEDRVTLNPSAVLGLRLQRNVRDLVPNTGVVLSGVAEVDVWADDGQAGRRPAQASRALVGQADAYLPVLSRFNTGVRVTARAITQNQGSIFNLDAFVPRGFDGSDLGSGTFAQVGAEVVQPLWFPEDGTSLVPLYFKALYAYGFAETLRDVDAVTSGDLTVGGDTRWSSVGAGLGLQARLFYVLDLELRIGAAYQMEDRDWEAVGR